MNCYASGYHDKNDGHVVRIRSIVSESCKKKVVMGAIEWGMNELTDGQYADEGEVERLGVSPLLVLLNHHGSTDAIDDGHDKDHDRREPDQFYPIEDFLGFGNVERMEKKNGTSSVSLSSKTWLAPLALSPPLLFPVTPPYSTNITTVKIIL